MKLRLRTWRTHAEKWRTGSLVHVAEIDDLLGAPARLAILATVADGAGWTFSDLGAATGLSDGNLHVQTGKLAEAGLLRAAKARRGGRSVTRFEITLHGRRVMEDHVRRLEAALASRRDRTGSAVQRGGELGSTTDASRVW